MLNPLDIMTIQHRLLYRTDDSRDDFVIDIGDGHVLLADRLCGVWSERMHLLAVVLASDAIVMVVDDEVFTLGI